MIGALIKHVTGCQRGGCNGIRETIDGATLYELLAGLEDWEPTRAHAVEGDR